MRGFSAAPEEGVQSILRITAGIGSVCEVQLKVRKSMVCFA